MTKYTIETGQLYTLNQTDHPPANTLEIEIVQVLPGEQGRVTFAVWELSPYGPRTAQGSATVPIAWLVKTLEAHRAELLSDSPATVPTD